MRWRLWLTAVASLLLSLTPVLALDLRHVLTGYAMTSWTQGDGLALNGIQAVVQDTQGYLWLGAEAGLVRFDGVRFALFRSPAGEAVPDAPVTALTITSDRSLWAAFAGGDILQIRDGVVLSRSRIPTTTPLRVLHFDTKGVLWAGGDGGLWRRESSGWTVVPLAQGQLPPVFTIAESSGDTLLVGTSTGLHRWSAEKKFTPLETRGRVVRGFSLDRAGRPWVTDPETGFRRLHEGARRTASYFAAGRRILHDSRGNTWVATSGQGLWRIMNGSVDDADIERSTVLTGLPNDGVWALVEDREGNIWAGTQAGITRLTPHRVASYVDVGIVTSVVADKLRGAWAVASNRLLRLEPPTPLVGGTPIQETPLPEPVRNVQVDQDGSLWLAMESGLFRLANGRLVGANPTGLHLNRVQAIAADPQAGLWIADNRRLVQWRGAHVQWRNLPAAITRPVALLFRDRRQRTWIAEEGGTVVMIGASGDERVYTAGGDYPHTLINAVTDDEMGNVWISGSHGLTRISDAGIDTLSDRHGLPNRRVMAVAEDRHGHLWLSVAFVGVLRIARSEVDLALRTPSHRLQYRLYGTADGIAGLPGRNTQQDATSAADGSFWFITGRGITVIDPESLETETFSAPNWPVLVQAATSEQGIYPIRDGVALPPRPVRLRIDYTTFNLTFPERAQFRYRLNGFEQDWVDAGSARQAFYTNLPPGKYEFQVQIRTPETPWRTGDTWAFSVRPTFAQTPWFIGLCLGGLGLLTLAGWRVRVAQMRRDFSMVLAERARLSRDIHDTLLQNMVALLLQLTNMSHDASAGIAIHERLQKTRRNLEDSIREVREAVWNLRPGSSDSALIERLEQIARRLINDGATSLQLKTVGRPRPLTADTESQLLRIAQEAVSNAVQHGAATTVGLELSYEPDTVSLRVSDDGCGFNATTAEDIVERSGHLGLTSMRERCVLAHGQLRVQSHPGEGTVVRATLPHS